MLNKKAFSLAETLIVLIIIGIIAFLTIPQRIANVQNRTRLTQITKAYESLDQVYDYALNEEKNVIGACTLASCTGVTENLTLKDAVENIFYNNMRASAFNASSTSKVKFTTRDGMEFTFSNFNDKCPSLSNTDKDSKLLNSADALSVACMVIDIDVNGADKKPNKPTDKEAIADEVWNDQYRLYVLRDSIEFLKEENMM